MKILSYALIFLGFLILGVLALLFLTPRTVRYELSFQTSADTDAILEYFIESDQFTLWMENLDSAERFEPYPARMGSARELFFKGDGSLHTMEEITDLRENDLSLRTTVRDLLQIDHRVSIVSNNDFNTVHIQSQVTALKRAMRFSLIGAKKGMKEQALRGSRTLESLLKAGQSSTPIPD
ncbi:MAG: hypothetical protein H6606_03555 [Flavobacteriales bacterium]|nr:hypothetical protein [Flavobacteriales bacterium]